jgi:hypothetical protein
VLWGIFRGAVHNKEGEKSVKRAIQTCVLTAAAVLLTISSLSANAGRDYYRWMDERGNPVHSDRPPPKGVDYEVVSTGSSLTRQVGAEEGAVPAETEPSVGNEFERVNAEQTQLVKKNPEYCQRARENLATLNTAARIRVRNDQGEFRYLDEEEKEFRRKESQDAIDVHCE